MDRYAVVGNPIAHSRSPRIHALFAKQTGESLTYHKLWAPQDAFVAVAEAFFAGGGHGLNVTVPFKGAAYDFATTLSERAQAAGAVNTLRREADGGCRGDNTDGVGLLRDLQGNLGIEIAGKRVLVLGAGGAASGILPALLTESPAGVVLANRTVARAEALAARFTGVQPCGLDAIPERSFELIINTTAAGLHGELPPLPAALLAPGGTAYDLLYADGDTPFTAWARAHGAGRVADGLGMLVEQAAESFFLWRGVRPSTAAVIAELRANG